METSAIFLFSSNTIYILLTCAIVSVFVFISEISVKLFNNKTNNSENSIRNNKCENNCVIKRPPGPTPLPIIGNLISLDGYEVPYQAFGELRKKYGDIISLKLGSVPAVVVNGIQNIKEVLITKSSHFDSRPNFRRYHQLFCGNKENSLAFCDWSETQKLRRDMLISHTFPKSFSVRFQQLNEIIRDQMDAMINDIKIESDSLKSVKIKPLLLETCANIFIEYFCTRKFDSSNVKFQKMVKNFDKIFYEVNQGYAADFLPFLLPLHKSNLKKLEQWSHEIREFLLENIIEDRFESWQIGSDPNDYVDSLIDHVKQNQKPTLEWDTALFALEDMIGGHAAVGNFLVKLFGYVALNENVQKNLQIEIDQMSNKHLNGTIDLNDRNQMVYTEAVIMESLRLIASPIVPHVSSQDSTIAGYDVQKDTLIFLNNYDLSMSDELWTEPEKFMPERFIKSGRLLKPDHFLPFGSGRRSCLGYKMVQMISFSILSSIMQQFNIVPLNGVEYKVPAGSLAMPEHSYEFEFVLRT